MKRRSRRKRHVVRAALNIRELTRAGTSLELYIYGGGRKIGEVVVGRGSLYWYGAHRKRRKRIDWTRFAEMMDELAYSR
jgi:hypothetical protein